jgi:predicted nucleic acid-binding protein
MVVIDATMLMPLLRPDVPIPAGPDGVPIDGAKSRIDYLVKQLEKDKTKIIVPTPALSEVLVRVGTEASEKIIGYLQKFSVFRIEPFDTRAAIEVAAMTRELLNSRERRRGTSSATWTKIKFDRQIVAIAKVCNATVIYSDDEDIRKIAARAKIKVQGLADLPLPPEDAQLGLELTGSAEDSAQPEAVTERDERAKRAKPSYRWEV